VSESALLCSDSVAATSNCNTGKRPTTCGPVVGASPFFSYARSPSGLNVPAATADTTQKSLNGVTCSIHSTGLGTRVHPEKAQVDISSTFAAIGCSNGNSTALLPVAARSNCSKTSSNGPEPPSLLQCERKGVKIGLEDKDNGVYISCSSRYIVPALWGEAGMAAASSAAAHWRNSKRGKAGGKVEPPPFYPNKIQRTAALAAVGSMSINKEGGYPFHAHTPAVTTASALHSNHATTKPLLYPYHSQKNRS